ncbi:Uncharacterised protein [Canicola haemoglobinophilus]|uniref:Uncharacterized protein n=1 Tax=Canicola haemoglobinophilus TaxID=733 RepID=A0AB38HCS8_9PAST|nr:hypothetical protein [Canicola haemoglobinophilus]STO55010.1 Uncharacterised protein [Canicola haemoglobinophilus]STO69419.1 Uncharacterised protein [Canicola haemoglobinophilus]
MKNNNFYFSWLKYSICVFLFLLMRDVIISTYIYIYDGVFIIDFSFKEAGIATLIFVTPYFFINWLGYKYGKGSKYDKEKRLKEKLTYKIINDRYREKKREKD